MSPKIFYAIYIIGGLAMFLYGIRESTRFFRNNLGDTTRSLMVRCTRKKWQAFTFGVFLSAMTQSSTIATSFAVGFVDVGLLSFGGSIVVMMGASLGGTFVSFLLSLNIIDFAPALFALAFMLSGVHKKGIDKFAGILMGLSLVFTGMMILNLGVRPLFADPDFRGMVTEFASSEWKMSIAALIGTGVLQSSSAVAALGIALATSNVLPADAMLPIVLGAHVGSMTMVLIAGLGGRLSARRLGVATCVYKVTAGLCFIPMMPYVHEYMMSLGFSPAKELVGGQIFLACVNMLLFYPFSTHFAELITRFIGGKGDLTQPRYLDENMLNVPALAVLLLSKEMIRVANYLEAYFQMLLYPEMRVKQIYAPLAEGIKELSNSCVEYMYHMHVPGENDALTKRFSSLSYTMTIFREIGRLMTGGLKKRFDQDNASALFAARLGDAQWNKFAEMSLRMFRMSLRSFVVHEQGILDEVSQLEAQVSTLGVYARRSLGEGTFYDREASLIINMMSLVQGLLGMSKEVAQGEEFSHGA